MIKRLSISPRKEQGKQEKPSDYTETPKENSALLTGTVTPSANTLHRSCKTLSVYAFIECYCNNDLSFLTIEGNLTPEELQDTWNEILFEYSSLIKNENSQHLFEMAKRIGLLQYHIIYIENAIAFLEIKSDPDIIKEIRAMGYPLSDEPTKEELSRIISLAKRQVFELDEQTDEYNKLNKTATGKKQTEEEFTGTLIILSKNMGFKIDQKKTSVMEFAQIFNTYLLEIATLKKQSNG